MRVIFAAAISAAIAGCSSYDQVAFQAGPGQQAIIRDGVPALQSTGRSSTIMVRPLAREVDPYGRPVFVLAIANFGSSPVTFHVADITVQRTRNGQAVESWDVKTYEELMSEERRRQTFSAIGAALGAVGNSMSAANAGYGTANTTIYGPYGTYTAHTTVYSPIAAQIAQDRAAAQNAALFDNLIEEGASNLASLEQSVIKDNTIMPGEWYGGTVHIQPIASQASDQETKTYRAIVRVGEDSHVIEVVQSPAG